MIIQDYLCTTFDIDSNTSATILITLLVFILGGVFNFIVRSISNLLERRKIKKLFQYAINSILFSIKEQIKYLDIFIKTLDINSKDNFVLISEPIPYLDFINQTGHNKIYDACFGGIENICTCGKLKVFNKMLVLISALERFEISYVKHFDNFLIHYQEFANKYLDSTKKLKEYCDELIQKEKLDTLNNDEKEYLSKLDEIIFNWQRQESLYATTQLFLVEPIRKLNGEYGRLQLVNKSNESLNDMTIAFKSMQNWIQTNKDIFQSNRTSYKAIHKVLKFCNKKI